MAFWSDHRVEIKRSYRWLGFVHLYNYVDRRTGQRRGPPEPGVVVPLKPDDPKKQGRTIPPFLIKSFTKPTYSVPINELGGADPKTGLLQLKPGPPQWQAVSITAIDAEKSNSNVTNIFYSWMKRNGYDPSPDSFSKSSGLLMALGNTGYIKISLNQLDPSGKIFEKWDLIDPMLEEFNFGDALDYNNDQLVTVTMKFKISAAKYTFIRQPQDESGFRYGLF